MVIGGALANDMAGESKNKGIATILGAFVGGVIGQNIGAQLDERDRLLAGEAYNTALEYNPTDKAAEWKNPDTGNYGRVVPVTPIAKMVDIVENLPKDFYRWSEADWIWTRVRQPDGLGKSWVNY
ncbi:MAG: hypothetical protein CM15mP85_15980 [Rhodobacterales bacterium]|nr:MAG: hypothetical protein CM15mP85_15980 [Rhodobacterales bacterium]